METLLLLLVCVLLIGSMGTAWWQWSRSRRFEERLDEFSALTLVPDRLQALARSLEDLDPPQLRAELDALRRALDRIEDLAAVPPGTSVKAEGVERSRQVRALVGRHLREEGCRAVNILDSEDALEEEELAVRVECLRDGLRVLGTVKVSGNQVESTDLDSSYTMFP
ncbi:MAG: hypothetical protein QGH51_09515 [Planctomycetota bacterium]|jgi:hypothetical protein|nr:hypothetical protein [Planctomycetota bacterium]MDP6942248.1 hypothetical protein [Planctomycetota bacterium]